MSLGRRYVQYITRTYKRTGTLWDSRYKSSVIHADTYLLTCQRYIELNPVRAAMVDDPAHYRRTSYRHNALGATGAIQTDVEMWTVLLPPLEKGVEQGFRAACRSPAERQPNAVGCASCKN